MGKSIFKVKYQKCVAFIVCVSLSTGFMECED